MTSGGAQNGEARFEFQGTAFSPPSHKHWSASMPEGMTRLAKAERLLRSGRTIRYKYYFDDAARMSLDNRWNDVGLFGESAYVVRTAEKVVERCILMTTKPGDLVLDPTCGGGTTAIAAEKWGRRWIVIDTSRVALAITRQRLLTTPFDYYSLRDKERGVDGGFDLATMALVTRENIANNVQLDPVFAKHDVILRHILERCNKALTKVTKAIRQKLEAKLAAKQNNQGKRAISEADRRRWDLPTDRFEEWTLPFDTDEDWPKELADAVGEYRVTWRAKMDEVNACIAANAEPEELVDEPAVVKGVLRVSGPFTIEAVQPPEISLGDVVERGDEGKFAGEPDEMETFERETPTWQMRLAESREDKELQNLEAYLDKMLKLLRTDGVRFPNNKQMRFTRLEAVSSGMSGLHAEGRWVLQGKEDEDPEGKATVCIAFGPQYGPVSAMQVEELIRTASRRGYDDLVIAGFSFDGPAQAVIEEVQHPRLRIHAAHIRPDINPGMEGLLKDQPGSELFTVFGQPRTRVEGPDESGKYRVVMEGVDIYNPVDNTITPTGANKVAAWFIDSDYDGWTFCITQAFFPDKSAWKKLSKVLKGIVDHDRFEAFSGTESLPFPAGKHKRVAVKVIDPRGNEVMCVHRLGE
jgi:adenine-specific DNA-methyltransferase